MPAMIEGKSSASGYTVRCLPLDEWEARRAELGYYTSYPPNAFTILVVVETAAGEIVASWMAMNTVHLEGLYIAPSHRGSAPVAEKLLSGMIHTLIAAGIPAVLTLATDPQIERLAEHAGFTRVAGALYQRALTAEGGT